MIVYVESNFVLELGLRQEEHEPCERILRYAETDGIDLVVPAYSLAEPYETWHRRASDREEARDRLDSQLTQLSRSESYADVIEGSTHITALLTRSIDEDKKRIDDVCRRLLTSGSVATLDGATARRALELQVSRDLSPQDAVVFASILFHLEDAAPDDRKVFVTRDPDDFLTPEITGDLEALDARLIPSFMDAVGFLEASLNGS